MIIIALINILLKRFPNVISDGCCYKQQMEGILILNKNYYISPILFSKQVNSIIMFVIIIISKISCTNNIESVLYYSYTPYVAVSKKL